MRNTILHSLFSYDINGKKTEIDQGVVATFHNSAQATDITTAAHPEGIVYYLKYGKIYSSQNNQLVYDPNVSVTASAYSNFGTYGFFVTPNFDIYLFANCYDSNYKQETCLIKNNDVLLATGQKLNNININYLYAESLKGNSKGDISFVFNEVPAGTNGYQHLVNYSGETKKKYKIKKTISTIKQGILTPVGNPDFFRMIPTIDTTATICQKKVDEPSKVHIKVECQTDEDNPINIEGCQIQMRKELGEFICGHYDSSNDGHATTPHSLYLRPLGKYLKGGELLGPISYDIPIAGFEFD